LGNQDRGPLVKAFCRTLGGGLTYCGGEPVYQVALALLSSTGDASASTRRWSPAATGVLGAFSCLLQHIDDLLMDLKHTGDATYRWPVER